jgi:transposase
MKQKPAKSSKRRRTKKATASAAKPALDLLTHPAAAGIDVGAEEFVAAVPPGPGGEDVDFVRTFPSFTSGVEALRDWLLTCGIKTAAIESTGNYWITLYDTLTQAGIEVYLVNARHIKGVPGKKTDVCDARWLQQLHAAGLLRKSFRPAQDIVPLRFVMRHRAEMCGDASRQLQHMQKALTEMNLKIHHVFSDIDGGSALAIIEAILAGERDADRLAALRDQRCKSPLETIKEALRGDYRPEYLFVLRQSYQSWQQLRAAMAECDLQIAALSAQVVRTVDAPLPPPAGKHQHRPHKNSPQMTIFHEAWRFYGVDLSLVPGAGASVLTMLMSEVGTREQLLSAFPTAAAFCSWMGLCPDNRISGGKLLKARTRKVPCRLAGALRLGAFGLNQSRNGMGDYHRRMKARLGKAEGTVATAHKLARILYAMIKNQTAYDENEAFKITPSAATRRRRRLERQAAALGLVLRPAA